MSRGCRVVVLTALTPDPVSRYVIHRLLEAHLVGAIVRVKPARLRWKLRQLWRIGRRSGLGAVRRRLQAGRLRSRLLAGSERRYLHEGLLSQGADVLSRVPDDVEQLRGGSLASRRTLRIVSGLQPELAIQAGAGWVLPPLLDVPPRGFLSLHHGMMPAIRGMDSILWGYVANRPDWIGITLQLLDSGLDTGRIVGQQRIAPEPGENPYSVVARASEVGADLMCRAIPELLAGNSPEVRKPAMKGTYRSALTPKVVRELSEMIEAGRIPEG
jgi:folate-dependent phosphoribosylglycinamide formyltransferase PurN